MKTCTTVAETRIALAGAPRPVGFFPTMGALHEGHAAVMRRCRAECATAVASVFVNPTQFGPGEDLARYPRDLAADERLLGGIGVDLLFVPPAREIYPGGFGATIDIGPLATVYEGASRPGHFGGVCTVVLKLFHIIAPNRAYFAWKDAQQLAVIRRMVRDLDVDVEIVAAETVRAADGLALSSRNAYLSPQDRARAVGLSRCLLRGRSAWQGGERDPARLVEAARDPALDYDYLACVDPETFAAPAPDGPALLIAAVRVGGTRLIDNVSLDAGRKA
ncbi:MAG: pantoate--beta-alanine ligase [Planctomycetota bacterium]